MIRTLGRVVVIGLLVGLPGFSGCGGKGPEAGHFLKNYGQLQQTPTSGGWYVYFNPERPIANYKEFTISPLIIQFTPRREKPVSMQDVDNVVKAYDAALEAALTKGGRFQHVNQPGDRVLVLRGSVSDLYQRDPKGPVGLATLEMEGIDSITRKRVFAVIEPMLGSRDSSGARPDPRVVFNQFAQKLREQIDQASAGTKK